MRKKRVVLLCLIGAALAIIALLAYKPTSREPSYGGHPLRYWVATLAPPRGPSIVDPSELDKATNAIDHIGVAALPFLVKWIQFDPPPWRRQLAYRLARTPFPPAQKLANWIIDPTLPSGTELAFAQLGPRAMPAFDELSRLMNDTNRPSTPILAARALARLGTNSLPQLLTALTNSHHPAHPVALSAISSMPDLEHAAQQVLPVLANCVNSTNVTDQVLAIMTLGRLNQAPDLCIPALVSFLKSRYPVARIFSANALAQFTSQAAAAVPALTDALEDPDDQVRSCATNALLQIDPAAFTNALPQ